MTNLEQFLNKKENLVNKNLEKVNGSFSCQTQDCNEIIYDGFADKEENRLFWKCSQGHESSVAF